MWKSKVRGRVEAVSLRGFYDDKVSTGLGVERHAAHILGRMSPATANNVKTAQEEKLEAEPHTARTVTRPSLRPWLLGKLSSHSVCALRHAGWFKRDIFVKCGDVVPSEDEHGFHFHKR